MNRSSAERPGAAAGVAGEQSSAPVRVKPRSAAEALVGRVHGDYVHGRRVRVLSEHFIDLIPAGATTLDVGCGDGRISRAIQDRRPDVRLTGIEVLVRPDARIPVQPFDGSTIPYPDGSVDVVMFVDVLHHTDDPAILLAEAARVARGHVVIKDHTLEGFMARPTLRLMDWVGNARHGVALPFNYWPRRRWLETFAALGLRIESWAQDLGLYPAPARWVFERDLHFIAKLVVDRPSS